MSRNVKQAVMYLLVPCLFLLILFGIYKIVGVSIENYVTSQLYMAIEKGNPDYKETIFSTEIENSVEDKNQGKTEDKKQNENNEKQDEKQKQKQEKQKKVLKSEITNPTLGERYAKVYCEDIDLNAFLYFGDTKEILKHGIGQYEKSNLPGFGTTILVCGNNHTYMKPLEHIKENHIITIATEYGTYQYKVRETKVVATKEIIEQTTEQTKVFQLNSKKEQLILYTSYPFGNLFKKSDKTFFVYCDKIAGPNIEEE